MPSTTLTSRQTRKAMGVTCTATIIGTEAPIIAKRCLDRVVELERLWSRFIPDSDICRINAASGDPVLVDDETVSLIRHMIAGAEATHGRFDPTLLPLQIARGDAKSLVDSRHSEVPRLARPAADAVAELRGIEFPDDRTVRLPNGLTLDAGGVGKGRAADVIVAEAIALGADAACINLGGDMCISGPTPDGNGWTVDILDPVDLRTPVASVVVNRGGVATSSMSARSRSGRGIDRHIVSSDNEADDTTVRGATVLASTAAWAEMWTKYAVLAPTAEAIAELDRLGLAALIVRDDGSLVATSTWEDFVP